MRNDSLVVNLFTLLGSTSIKAASKTLMKLTPVTDGLLPIVIKLFVLACSIFFSFMIFYIKKNLEIGSKKAIVISTKKSLCLTFQIFFHSKASN